MTCNFFHFSISILKRGDQMLNRISMDLTTKIQSMALPIDHTPKSPMYICSTLKGLTPDGRYVHLIKNGRVTYHPAYYAIDGRLLQPHL